MLAAILLVGVCLVRGADIAHLALNFLEEALRHEVARLRHKLVLDLASAPKHVVLPRLGDGLVHRVLHCRCQTTTARLDD